MFSVIIIINILFFCITSIIIIMIILSGLLSHYGPGHHDYTDTNMALSKVQKELLSSFFGTNKSSFIYKDFTWKNEGTDNHQETVDKAERIGKPCEADGAPEGLGDYHHLPSFLKIAENQSLCWVHLMHSLIVILLSGDYYDAFVLLLFETQNMLFLCLICISTFQVGYDNLVQSGREFVREGCLQKLSRKGYQQRMFFLVSFLSSTFSSCSS